MKVTSKKGKTLEEKLEDGSQLSGDEKLMLKLERGEQLTKKEHRDLLQLTDRTIKNNQIPIMYIYAAGGALLVIALLVFRV